MAREPDRPSPKPRLDKLGIRPGMRVVLLAVTESAFEQELAARDAEVTRGRVRSGANAVFLEIARHADLSRLSRLRESIDPAGAIWALWRKGRRELSENHVRDAALAAGLVDVKVVAFSETLSALKLVIPLARRGDPRPTRSDRAKSGRNQGGGPKSL
jgi:hypothetical protein